MRRVVVAAAGEVAECPFPNLHGVSVHGHVRTVPVIVADDRPLLLWQHELAEGTEIRFEKPPVGHVVYIQDGGGEAGERYLSKEGALIVAHGGTLAFRAQQPTTILHFHRPETYPDSPPKAGGCVHVLNKEEAAFFKYVEKRKDVTDVSTGNVYADSGCPTCEIWFHMSEVETGGMVSPRHFHTEDEIIVVVKGSMLLGRRNLDPVTAVAIDANTVYTFKTGEAGMSFVNFRAADPFVALADSKEPPLNERQLVQQMMAGEKSLGDVFG